MTIAKTRFEWCSSPDNSFLEIGHEEQDIPKRAYNIPEEIGKGWFQAMQLPLKMVIRRGSIQFNPEASGKLFPLTIITEQFSEPLLCIQSARKGRVILSDKLAGDDFIFGHDACLFQHIESRDSCTKLDTSENFEITTLLVGDSVVRELCGKEYAQSLMDALKITAIPATSIKTVPHHINALLHSSMPDHLTGNIAKLHAQAKVLEYLCGLTDYFSTTIGQQAPKSEIQNRIKQMHYDLLQLEGKVPSLNDLAKQYGLSVRQLKDEFGKMYGKSLFSYISEVRINEAHAALLNTDIPMKIIAKNLGYSHVNHFINAFGKQFGYSPGSLRKKK